MTLGVLVMRTQGVPVRIWAQHGLLGLAALAGAGWLSRFLRGGVPKAWVVLAILVPFLLLGGTFLNKGVEGIHRWVRLGPVLIHSASLAAPPLGAFPVPVMGFGASPMLGYALSLAWLLSRPGRQCTVTVTEAVALP